MSWNWRFTSFQALAGVDIGVANAAAEVLHAINDGRISLPQPF